MSKIIEEIFEYIKERYGSLPENLWAKFPQYAIFRHHDNKKWFSVFMNISRQKLGLEGEGETYILVLKCDPIFKNSISNEPGILPGYHLNKNYWISVLLDGSCQTENIKTLIDLSFKETKK